MKPLDIIIPGLAQRGPGARLTITVEQDEDGDPFVSAVLTQDPPDGGWPTGREIDRYDVKCVAGVSADFEDAHTILELAAKMFK